MRRLLVLIAALLLTSLGLTACGGSDSSPSGNDTPVSIDVTVSGDSVTPEGERVQVGVGQPVQLVVTADAPGEIHVHSSPEQELSYDKGTSTVTIKPIDKPGIVEVESHTLEKTILQLEVR